MGPFEKAKVGDWIIDSEGRCARIESIEEGEFGGVRTSKYSKFFWGGNQFTRNGSEITARLATSKEVAAWHKQVAERKAERDRADAEEDRRERVRNAAEDLLEACKKTVAAIEDCRRRLGFPTQAIADAFDDCTAAIKKATKK